MSLQRRNFRQELATSRRSRDLYCTAMLRMLSEFITFALLTPRRSTRNSIGLGQCKEPFPKTSVLLPNLPGNLLSSWRLIIPGSYSYKIPKRIAHIMTDSYRSGDIKKSWFLLRQATQHFKLRVVVHTKSCSEAEHCC